jgi:GntR family transcriptional repressor for pyruvate dehydrogenase complex
MPPCLKLTELMQRFQTTTEHCARTTARRVSQHRARGDPTTDRTWPCAKSPRRGRIRDGPLRTGIASPWGQLVADHPALRDDILEFRRVLEGATAYFAALRANAGDRKLIAASLRELERYRRADDKAGEAVADAKLHDAIALASHNTMFLHLHTSILGMLREHIAINGSGLREHDKSASDRLLMQHRAVCEAICGRRPEEARTAMQAHIDFARAHVENDPS